MFDSIASLFCALGVAWTGYTLAFIVANKWADQWYNADGSAHHCEECGSGYLVPISRGEVAGHVSEVDWRCGRCDAQVGYWAYGADHPIFRDGCVADAMALGRWLGPLLGVGVVLVGLL